MSTDTIGFVYSLFVHLFAGLFISIATKSFDYLAPPPYGLCGMTPMLIFWSCANATDWVRQLGIFMSLGIIYIGSAAGATTFSNERVVFWRERSSGTSCAAYLLAKVLADIPRVALSAASFTVGFVYFYPSRTPFHQLYLLIFLLYSNAFSIGMKATLRLGRLTLGYFLGCTLKRENIGVSSTGFALLLSLLLSGVVPALKDIITGGLRPISFVWAISGPRWFIEALWISEVSGRSFENVQIPDYYDYHWEDFYTCFGAIAGISVMWNVLAFIGLVSTGPK